MTQENSKPSAGDYARLYTALGFGLLFNPWLMRQVLAQSFGQLWGVLAALLQGRQSIAARQLSLPFAGCWKVYRGGITREDSHSWGVLAQRFAYDFVISKEGSTHTGDGRSLKNYYAFGQPLVAPASGVVVAAVDRYRDYPYPGDGWIDWRARDIRGNHVILKHDEEAFSLIAHLRQGSCCVNKNQHVEAGQQIGECGNSGHSTEPHIHIHVQDRRNFYTAIGRPIQFKPAHISSRKACSASTAGTSDSRDWAQTGDIIEPSIPDAQGETFWQLPATTLTWRDAVTSFVGTTVSVAIILFVLRAWARLIEWSIS